MTKAQQYCEEMSAAAASYDASMQTDAKWKNQYKRVKFIKHDNKRGLRFDDGSKVFYGTEGRLILPVDSQ